MLAGSARPGDAYTPGSSPRASKFLYVSGQVPVRDGLVVGETVAEQTALALDNVVAVLAEAGASLEDVVRCGVYLNDIADFAEMTAAYREKLSEPLPARTTVGVTLAGSVRGGPRPRLVRAAG